MKKVLLLAALSAGLIGVSAAQASSKSAPEAKGKTHIMEFFHKVRNGATSVGGGGPLLYHGGPVMHTNTNYTIYWAPEGSVWQDGYSTLIDQYFTDIAADSGLLTNPDYTATQYHDGTGNVQYASRFGGSYTDTTPLPLSGCKDSFTAICLTDQQLRVELKKDIALNGWPVGPSTEFFLFTPRGVSSCTGSMCSFSTFCGYHSVIGSGDTEILYANMPYADTAKKRCDGGQHPNANSADATISIASHEHNETITNPRGNAWHDKYGYEDGDKCAWMYGTMTGPMGAKYNETINGHHYFLQEEYSNADKGCVQSGL